MKSFTVCLIIGLLAAGCATQPDPRPLARDVVCLYNRDLGCVEIRVEADTPKSAYGGKTYYFCSDACRADFEKEPSRYAALLEGPTP